MKNSCLFTLFLVLSWTTIKAQTSSGSLAAPSRDDFEGIQSFLSSDWMEGRGTGTRGALMAADYIASMMQLSGLLPYGDTVANGKPGAKPTRIRTYLQNFKMIRCHVERSSLALIRNTPEGESALVFAPGTDYQLEAIPLGRETEAQLVFAGYGIEAADKGYNDYAGIDVRNRIVMILEGYPGHASTNSSAYKKLGSTFGDDFATLKKKLKTAEKNGAAAVVFINPKVLNSQINEPISVDEDDENPRHYLPADPGKLNIPCFTMGTDATIKLLEGSAIDLSGFENKAAQDLSPGSAIVPGKKLRFSISIKSEELIIRNVLGMIRGKDTTRNIIIGGHYDHLGISKGEIFNGADDNASGVAGMLALAKIWANTSDKPACNLIFAAWVGEERGKLGSVYFARNSKIVPDHVSLVINMDMISRSAPEDTGRIALSIGTMTLNEDLRTLAKHVNSKLDHPFVLEIWDVTGASGSDYRPFADRKVPILTFHAGFPDEYHTPQDDFSRVDANKMEQILKIVHTCLIESLQHPPVRER
ncbi:MAG: M28 family peptidase [Bacteroidetes bacterium]|nr:M28 family peptidase [Bacteroidota bacterium]